jgi:hypothetical protein
MLAIDLQLQQVAVYVASSTLKLKMKIDSDEKFEARFQGFITER